MPLIALRIISQSVNQPRAARLSFSVLLVLCSPNHRRKGFPEAVLVCLNEIWEFLVGDLNSRACYDDAFFLGQQLCEFELERERLIEANKRKIMVRSSIGFHNSSVVLDRQQVQVSMKAI